MTTFVLVPVLTCKNHSFKSGAEGIRTPGLRRAKAEVSGGEAVGATVTGRREKGPITLEISSGLRGLCGSADRDRIPPQHTSSCHNPLLREVRTASHGIT